MPRSSLDHANTNHHLLIVTNRSIYIYTYVTCRLDPCICVLRLTRIKMYVYAYIWICVYPTILSIDFHISSVWLTNTPIIYTYYIYSIDTPDLFSCFVSQVSVSLSFSWSMFRYVILLHFLISVRAWRQCAHLTRPPDHPTTHPFATTTTTTTTITINPRPPPFVVCACSCRA